MRIIKTENPDGTRMTFKEFMEKNGKKVIAAAGGVLIIGTAILLNVILPQKTAEPAENAEKTNVSEKADADFFAASVLNRSKARDEAIEVLHTVADLGGDDEAAAQALSDIARISSDMEKEANIETMIKAKGFSECIAVISGDTVNIVVKCDSLLPNEIAQIKEIAYTNANVLPENVVITPKA